MMRLAARTIEEQTDRIIDAYEHGYLDAINYRALPMSFTNDIYSFEYGRGYLQGLVEYSKAA